MAISTGPIITSVAQFAFQPSFVAQFDRYNCIKKGKQAKDNLYWGYESKTKRITAKGFLGEQ